VYQKIREISKSIEEVSP